MSFFNFDSFGFSLFAFRFSTKALGKNINFVCFFNRERKWLVFPENPPHTFGWETKLPSSHKYILLDDLVFMLLGSTMLKASCAEQEKWWIFSSVRKWRNIFSASSVTSVERRKKIGLTVFLTTLTHTKLCHCPS